MAKALIAGVPALVASRRQPHLSSQVMRSRLGELGAGIQLRANAIYVLRHIGLEKRIAEVGVSPDGGSRKSKWSGIGRPRCA